VQWATTKLPFIPAALYQRFTVLVSDTVNPNVLAGNIVLIMPIAIGILLFSWKTGAWAMRVSAFINLVVCSGILLLTQSRSALIALALAIALFVILRWRWGWVLIATAGLMGIIIYQMGLIPAEASAGMDPSGTIIPMSLEGRMEIWSRAIYAIQDFSFTGIGMGSFTEVVDLLYPLFLAAPGKVGHAHNLFLQVAVDLGIPGLIAWLSILFGVIVAAWQLYRYGKKYQDHWAAGLGAGFLGSQIALIVHGLTDAVTWGMVRPAPLVWGIWGATIAAWYVLTINPKKPPAKAVLLESS
jgi:putative inorganic carbon (HCO3(-)) transporter